MFVVLLKMFVYAAMSAAVGGGSWRGDDVGSRTSACGVLWRASYWLALIVFVPGVQSSLPTKLDICLGLQQSHFGNGSIRICIILRQTKCGQDELAEVVVVEAWDIALLPRIEVGIRAETRRVLGLRSVRNGRHLQESFLPLNLG